MAFSTDIIFAIILFVDGQGPEVVPNNEYDRSVRPFSLKNSLCTARAAAAYFLNTRGTLLGPPQQAHEIGLLLMAERAFGYKKAHKQFCR